MTLLEKQQIFSLKLASLILKAQSLGLGVTMGECWRTPEQAALNAKAGIGSAKSLHCDRLAVDINIFYRGKWLITKSDFIELGKWWATQSTKDYSCVWGGEWGDDYNHFSISHNGKK